MENRARPDYEKLLKAFLDKDESFDYDALEDDLLNPGNEELKSEFDRLRKLTDLSVDENKIWGNVRSRIKMQPKRPKWLYLKYAAVIVLFVFGGWGIWFALDRAPGVELATNTPALPVSNKAYLLLSDGEQVELEKIVKGSVIEEQGYRVQMDSSGKISYSKIKEARDSADKLIYNTIVVPRGGEYKLVMSDGTCVWLNSDSQLKFPVHFTTNERNVYLKGEGYFQVAKNEDKPFRVTVDNDMVVRVLGTSFNINAYNDLGSIVTTLISGKVDILNLQGESLITMKPNQQVNFHDGEIAMQEVDALKTIAWVNGKFYFQELPLEKIVLQLQRWYDIEVDFRKEALKSYEFTGVLRRDMTVEQIFEIIEKTTNVKVSVDGRNVAINTR